MYLRKYRKGLLALLMIPILLLAPVRVAADVKPIEDTQGKLDEITEEEKKVLNDLFAVTQRIENLEGEEKELEDRRRFGDQVGGDHFPVRQAGPAPGGFHRRHAGGAVAEGEDHRQGGRRRQAGKAGDQGQRPPAAGKAAAGEKAGEEEADKQGGQDVFQDGCGGGGGGE